MKSSVCPVVVAALLAGIVNAQPTNLNFEAGVEYAFTILVFPRSIESCHLKTPAGETLDFVPGVTTKHGDRYELQPVMETMPQCSVMVKNLRGSDSGSWEVSYKAQDGSEDSRLFELYVEDAEKTKDEDDNDNITWLENSISFPTRTDRIVDISLSKIEHDEQCYIRSPGGEKLSASEANVDGVTVHNSSKFVSCRITIGPMVESLLGDWVLCGKHTANDKAYERCQLFSITWNNDNRPDTVWDTTMQAKFDHPVHFGKTLTTTVIGNGNVVSCHVITPNGEDIVITQESQYPNLKAVTIDHSICSIAIGEIDASLLGDWTIYGVFRNFVSGLNEVHLPISMFLYDENNPHNQAYNVTVLGPVHRVVNLGNTLHLEVSNNGGQVDSCYSQTPSGNLHEEQSLDNIEGAVFVNDETRAACRLAVGPVTKELLGEWKLIGKFSNNGLFTEIQQTFKIIQEDPANPIIDIDRDVILLREQEIKSRIGEPHRVFIHADFFTADESCHLVTPDGLQYKIMEGFNVTGVEIIEESDVECGVIVNVISEDVIGDWVLIARATRFSIPIERRLPFTIYIEENVEALQNEVTVTEGNDLIVRLRHPTDLHETCKLFSPFGRECPFAERDPLHVETCGFIKPDMQTFNNGTWTIQYGNRTIYKAVVHVTVNAENSDKEPVSSLPALDLERDRPVNEVVGPEDAVYCRLEDPQGVAVFDGFGRCILTLDKVTTEHHGIWTVFVGIAGKVIAVEYQLFVAVKESGGKAVVTTHVEMNRPVVAMSCAVSTEATVRACKFRDPQGRILLAASESAEDRYEFHGSEVSYESNLKTHECGIRITNPLNSDLGLWRCAIEADDDTYYGFLALHDTAIAANVQQEPILKADRSSVSVVEGDTVAMSCSVPHAIRYCYFRAANGTTFSVSPGMSSASMEYVGAGFDAGECGVRFHGMSASDGVWFHGTSASDGSQWSCHVGLQGSHDEQRDQIQLTIHERMSVNHYYSHDTTMVVEGIVYDGRALEYCRFVRIDGLGFTTENVPSGYTVTGDLTNGVCRLTKRDPTILDIHPWTVAAKIRGQDEEISKDTMEAILITAPTTEAPNEGPGSGHVTGGPDSGHDTIVIISNPRGAPIFLYVLISVGLFAILMGAWWGPKKHRDWTFERASAARQSLQRSFSFRKQPIQQNQNV